MEIHNLEVQCNYHVDASTPEENYAFLFNKLKRGYNNLFEQLSASEQQ